ncbi:hypothetical protein I4674_10515 [Proteus mirabilis]|nr:hypothetical protein [Proteus mirabilis]
MKVKLYAKEIKEQEWQEHKVFLNHLKIKVKEINQKFNYEPISDTFSKKKPH